MQNITKSELATAAAWFAQANAAAYPNWTQEARYILRLRAKGYGYGKIAEILNRLYRGADVENNLRGEIKSYNRQTVRNRYLWALTTWRANT